MVSLAAQICFALVENPMTTSISVLLVTNAIILGFGFWWDASALKIVGIVNLLCLTAAFLNERCIRLDPRLTTVLWGGPVASGIVLVRAYRCLHVDTIDTTQQWQSECSDIDVGSFAWTVDLGLLGFFLSWLDGIVQWFVHVINRIPEGLSWLNLFAGVVFMVVSLFYWDWCGGDVDEGGYEGEYEGDAEGGYEGGYDGGYEGGYPARRPRRQRRRRPRWRRSRPRRAPTRADLARRWLRALAMFRTAPTTPDRKAPGALPLVGLAASASRDTATR